MLQQDFMLFKDHCMTHKVTFNRITYDYLELGQGDDTIIILPGCLGPYEAIFPYMQHLSANHRVICPIYPAVCTMEEIVKGLRTIIRKSEAEHITLLGISFGATVAQCYMKQYPKRIEKLILCHPHTISEDFSEEAFHSRVLYLAQSIKATQMMPLALSLFNYKKKSNKLTKQLGDEKRFWKHYFHETVDSYTKIGIETAFGRMLNFITDYKLATDYLKDWNGQVLLLEATVLDGYSQIEVDTTHKLYPSATIHKEDGEGPVVFLSKRANYLAVIDQFLAN